MTCYVEIIHTWTPTPEGCPTERLPRAYRSVYEANLAGNEELKRRKPALGTLTFKIVDEHGNPAEGSDDGGAGHGR